MNSSNSFQQKKPDQRSDFICLAESEGFEPPVPYGTIVFKTTAFDHSANSPYSLRNVKKDNFKSVLRRQRYSFFFNIKWLKEFFYHSSFYTYIVIGDWRVGDSYLSNVYLKNNKMKLKSLILFVAMTALLSSRYVLAVVKCFIAFFPPLLFLWD